MAIAGIIYAIKIGDCGSISRYMGSCVGLLFLGFSFLSHEAIGRGDAFLFVILGWFLGIYFLIFGEVCQDFAVVIIKVRQDFAVVIIKVRQDFAVFVV